MSIQRAYLKGKTFGRLTVIGDRSQPGKSGYYWLCRCDCGVEKLIPQTRLVESGTKSCGCMKVENWARMKVNITSPRRIKRREYISWKSMIARCENKKHEAYPRYGGRGITVCDRWRWSFQSFFDDMGPKPTPKHTIERGNTNGNYEPSNCKWASVFEQQNNKSTTMIVSYRGLEIPLSNLCREENAIYSMVWRRIKDGYSVEDALNIPNMRPRKNV